MPGSSRCRSAISTWRTADEARRGAVPVSNVREEADRAARLSRRLLPEEAILIAEMIRAGALRRWRSRHPGPDRHTDETKRKISEGVSRKAESRS